MVATVSVAIVDKAGESFAEVDEIDEPSEGSGVDDVDVIDDPEMATEDNVDDAGVDADADAEA
jgi:hypothetical protein